LRSWSIDGIYADVPGPIDLTQVRTFVHLYESRSVTATAEALSVTQPTVSYTLGKLRRRFDDDLFVRTATGLQPTGTSSRLYEPLRTALAEIDRAVSSAEVFDPAVTTREFRVMLSDFGELSFLPLLVPAFDEHAPRARLLVRPLVVDAAADLLVSGELDLVITSVVLESERLTRLPFMEVDYAALVSAHHPRIRSRRASARTYARERFVSVEGTVGHQGPVDLLRSPDLHDRIELRLSSYASVPYVVAASELVAIVPRHIGGIFEARFDVRVVDLPWAIEPIRVAAYTRRSVTGPQRWLAELVVARLSSQRLR
jgi:DNA-binding transcriptional LysR family regulator